MLAYTVSSSQLAEADIYEIKEVSSLEEFLKEHSSLCIVKAPFEGTRPEMTRIEGKNRFGEPVRIYLECCSKDLGYIKSKLDKTLYSPFLFISWKQKGFHTFKHWLNFRIFSRHWMPISPLALFRKKVTAAIGLFLNCGADRSAGGICLRIW